VANNGIGLVVGQVTRKKAGYGWRKDLPDWRDRMFAADAPAPPDGAVPWMPDAYQQLSLSSCVGNGTSVVIKVDAKNQGVDLDPSRMFVYFNARLLEGGSVTDDGCEIRDAIKSIAQFGVAPESEWPYDLFRVDLTPDASVYTDALKHEALLYRRVPQELSQIKAAITSGLPIVGGISVYDSFESAEVAKTGIVPLPAPTESLLGGHCIVFYKYSDSKGTVRFLNSWGPDWGENGSGDLPYPYMTDPKLASDFWVVQTISA
jgi:C1A family cysteine protease